MVKVKSKAVVKEFKKSLELQENLNSYGMGFFNMDCEDIWKYLDAKHPNRDRSFVDAI